MLRYLILSLSLLLSPLIIAQPSANALAEQLANMQSLKAQFTQVVRDEHGDILQQASGELLMQQPRKLHWSTQSPYRHQVITDGTYLWTMDFDLMQASRRPAAEAFTDTPALLLSGDIDAINQHYDISDSMVGDEHVFYLTPKATNSGFETMNLRFRNQRPTALHFTDHFGQQTVIQLNQLQWNPPVDAQRFNFTPPAGVDVLVN
jgi:outer membrane lipoprotein carrier protein